METLAAMFIKYILVDKGISKKDANENYLEILEALRAKGAGL